MASRSWNRVELIGNLTRDPELRYTPNGAAVCTFGLATNRTYVTDGEKKEEVDFHRLVSWNKLAELCSQLLKKGSRIFVSGRLQTRSWESQDGQTRSVTEIVVEDMIILTPKSEASVRIGEDDVEAVFEEKPPVKQNAEVVPEEIKAQEEQEKPKKDEAEIAEAEEPAEPTEKPAEKPQENISDKDIPF